MTTSSEHTGTERYLSYELVTLRDEGKPTTASDIWALACVGLEVNIAIQAAKLGLLFSSSSSCWHHMPIERIIASDSSSRT
jgi:hypothetical protein